MFFFEPETTNPQTAKHITAYYSVITTSKILLLLLSTTTSRIIYTRRYVVLIGGGVKINFNFANSLSLFCGLN